MSGYKRIKRQQRKQKWKSKRAKGMGREGHCGGQKGYNMENHPHPKHPNPIKFANSLCVRSSNKITELYNKKSGLAK